MKIGGRVAVPGDKSISHRALILAALSDGTSRLEGVLAGDDVRSTLGALRALGADIPELSESMLVRGRGLRGLRSTTGHLDCGNSGTTARLLAGVVAAYPFATRFVGDASLSRRPMRRVARPLEAMGARVEFEAGDGLPMVVRGATLAPLEWRAEAPSAQVKSAVLLAGLIAGAPVSVAESAVTRDHTERMLLARGAALEWRDTTVVLSPTQAIRALDSRVPGDPSSAAFFAGLAALADEGSLQIPDVCVNPTRSGIFDALCRMGALVSYEAQRDEGGEPVAEIRVAPGELRGISIQAPEIPSMIDELPLLACVAARAEGDTVISGASELRVKESDRIAAVVENLRVVGADAEELVDGMRITGSSKPLRGRVATGGDHRTAMAFGVLAAIPGNAIEIDDPECVSVSYPGFWADLALACRG